MSRPESEEIDAALPPPGYSTPTKAKCNDGAGPAESNDERMETESEADVEKQFRESTAMLCLSPCLQNHEAVDHRAASYEGG